MKFKEEDERRVLFSCRYGTPAQPDPRSVRPLADPRGMRPKNKNSKW
jgi:hypothetical protein